MTADMSTADILTRFLAACDEHSDRPAITGSSGTTWTFAALGRKVRNTAAALRELGFPDGGRVQFSIRPEPRGIVFALGVVAAGGVVAFSDLGVTPEVHAARTARIRPHAVAAESVLYAADLPPARRAARRAGLHLPGLRSHRGPMFHAGPRLPGLPGASVDVESLAGRAGKIRVAAEPERLCLLVSTSGTTADPRIVAHTRGSLASAMELFAGAVDIAAGERVHSDQFFLGLAALCAGAHWTMPPARTPPRTDPAGFVRALRGAQVSFLVPADVELAAAAIASGVPDPGLRSIVVGAAPVTSTLLARAREAMPGTRVLATYGMTEILPIAVTDAEHKLAHTASGAAGDAVGPVLPGIDARIVDGRLELAGPNLMAGYLGADGEPEAVERLLTTDLAELVDGEAADPHIILLGRAGDMIIRGNTNIYPGLYEPALMAHDAIAHAALIGVADEIGDERVVAVVVPADGPHADIDPIRIALDATIDAAARPDLIALVPAMPTAGRSAKLDRAALRAQIARALADEAGHTGHAGTARGPGRAVPVLDLRDRIA